MGAAACTSGTSRVEPSLSGAAATVVELSAGAVSPCPPGSTASDLAVVNGTDDETADIGDDVGQEVVAASTLTPGS